MKRIKLILIFVMLIAHCSVGQIQIGLSTGVLYKQYNSSPLVETITNEIYFEVAPYSEGSVFFGLYFENKLLNRLRLKQELSIYKSQHGYWILAPTQNPNSNFDYYNATTLSSFATINYRAMISLVNQGPFRIRVGPSLDLNFMTSSNPDPPFYSSDYPEAAQLATALNNSYNLAVIYLDAEIGFKIRRFNLNVSYKHGLTSPTGSFEYAGNGHYINSNSSQVFFRLGYDILVKNR